jgi:glycosyltransferase involved in cell wall biosynthesis
MAKPESPTAPPRATNLVGLSICLVGINYAPDSTGIAPYTEAMARAFTDAGADVHVVTGIPHYPQWVRDAKYARGSRWDEVIDGIEVTRVAHYVPARPDFLGRGRMEASFLAGATRVVRADKSDIVIAVTPSLAGLGAARYGRRGRPLGVLVQDLTGNAAGESGSTGGWAARAIAAVEYRWLRAAQRVGVITPRFAAVLIDHGIAPSAIVDLPNFTHITPVAATRSEARSRLGWPDELFTVVHTGNMGMKQGLENVVEAARYSEKHGSGVHFTLVGDGNQRIALEASGAGVSTLTFINPLSSDDYPYALAAADTLLLNERPGVKEMSLPSKLTSYTSASRPIIAAVEPEGITHGVIAVDDAALLVAPGDAPALVAGAIRLREEKLFAQAYAAKALAMHEARYAPAGAKARYVAFAESLRSGS